MAETLERNETVRRIEPEFDGRGRPVWHSQLTPPDESCAQCVMVPDRVIPVIFVPGVMGSNLKPKGDDGPRWRMDGALSALAWIFRGPKTRKKFLQPGVMEVDQDGKVPKDMAVPAEELRRRGWGEISAMSYSGALRWLEEHLNDFSRAREGLRVRLMQEALGAEVGEACLTHEEVRLSYRYRFPVHACGYNWLADNVDSAHTLGARIDEIIARYNQTDRMRCEKVILVTHSMGGLVARYCSEVLGYRDRILGIVHGVMPAIGAAAVYRRMKAGTETNGSLAGWAAAQVIGANAEEMTAVLSTAPGP
ncbi:esterase/lipase family protein, partial [Caldimonas thermodepolymerans]